jgi:hypothetical protein
MSERRGKPEVDLLSARRHAHTAELTDEVDFVEKGRATEAKDRQTHKLPRVE